MVTERPQISRLLDRIASTQGNLNSNMDFATMAAKLADAYGIENRIESTQDSEAMQTFMDAVSSAILGTASGTDHNSLRALNDLFELQVGLETLIRNVEDGGVASRYLGLNEKIGKAFLAKVSAIADGDVQ